MRELKFNLDVEANALLCPNPSEWFAKSYITENVVGNFRTIPGVKEATKVAKNVFTNLIQPAGCSWAPVDTILDAEDISVDKGDVMVQLCQYDLESSFISAKMAVGDTNYSETEFLNHFWSELNEATLESLQLIRWNGDKTLTGTTSLRVSDGYIKKLASATGATEYTAFTAVTFTSANIISALTGTISLLPEAVKGRRKDVRIYMSEGNAFKYQLATLGLNTQFNYTGELALSFAGYVIAVQPGMSDDYIVAGNLNSFGYAFDGSGDAKSLKIVNMMDTAAEPVIRARIAMKMSFDILNDGKEIAYVKVG